MSTAKLSQQGFQIKNGIVVACNGLGLKNLLRGGEQWLETHVHVVNNLNVFPVPDGDTGTNMLLTMRSALAKIEETPDQRVGAIAAAAAKGALMGARGNSGVILSQFLQGLAQGFAGRVSFTAGDFARAVQRGVEQAYQSVLNPVEGTILTVARAIAEAAARSAAASEDLLVLLVEVLRAATVAQASTPSLLPVLQAAGVTDSGGQGLVYIFEGGLRLLNHDLIHPISTGEIAPVLPLKLKFSLPDENEAYGYDVQFLIQGEQLDVSTIRTCIDRFGWSTLVVGDEHLVKVHVHTQDPGQPLSYGAKQGLISDVVVDNLDQQAREFVHKVEETQAEIATIAVAPGTGLTRIFQSLGVGQVLSGGQTKNPSVQELLTAINQVKADNVLILPNNKNVILAAQQARDLSQKNVEVLPTQTVPQGIAALLSFNYQADLPTNVQRMSTAARQVQTIEVARVARDSRLNGFNLKTGGVMGLLDNELVGAGQDFDGVALEVLAQAEAEAGEIVTIYFGRDSSLEQANALASKIGEVYPELEVEVYAGGQPHYQYIISLE
ncbi:MAG: DAK2 domain-containing protein [Anaerolineae bacterium]|nr:DAK2 domain-containing protein [Anaerolineae bacterium]